MGEDPNWENEYQKLPDETLLELFKNRYELTPAAKNALLKCIQQRQLAGFDAEAGMEATAGNIDATDLHKISMEVLQWKIDGFNNDMILARLAHQGYSPEQVVPIAEQVKTLIHEKFAVADAARLAALTRLFCGAAVLVIAWLTLAGNVLYFIGLALIALSTIQAAIADTRKSRYKLLLKENDEQHPTQQAEE